MNALHYPFKKSVFHLIIGVFTAITIVVANFKCVYQCVVLQNSPKYITCLNPDEELSFQYKALSSLDFVEEKLSKGGSDLRELYLGMLYSLETHKM